MEENKIKFTEIKKLHAYRVFKKHAELILLETIKTFFNCEVKLFTSISKEALERFEINIHDNIRRGYYPIDSTSVLLIGRIFRNDSLLSAIGFYISNIDVKRTAKLLNVFERILTNILTSEFKQHFQNSSVLFGDEIIKRTISTFISKGGYDERQIRHLIEYFYKLRTTSFEGQYFSTGAIFTKSHDFLIGESDFKRFGRTKNLVKPFFISVTNNIEKRIWYLVDGKTSFFLGNKNLNFNSIFILDEEYSRTNYLDSHSLSLTLKGGDFLIKVENEKLLSINTSDGNEFIFFENKWKYRNYTFLKELLSNHINSTDLEIVDAILFFIISSSKKQTSTIMWFPNKRDKIDDLINIETKNSFIKDKINIKDKQAINHIFRCISSDGATVFSTNGDLEYMGVIVNLEKAKVSGMTGTGETAASILKNNGVAIKVSQDGLIKIFVEGISKPFFF